MVRDRELLDIIKRQSKRIMDLEKEISAYEKHKDDLEIEIDKRDKKIEMYLKIIDKFQNGKGRCSGSSHDNGCKCSPVDIDTEQRLCTLEDKVRSLEGNLKKNTKIIISTRNTINEFLKRIYK